ncbi:MAG: hypothetical protein H0T97_09415 [Actinobacteria bacterium]|nr:hypothetical protein [Actinomycetota bacterium]
MALTERETRVGAVLRIAADEISARTMSGETARDDLRAEVTPGRTYAAELAEAALKAAAQTHEERKIPFIGHLIAAIAFERDLSAAHANQLIATADTLTYRQLVVLAVLATRQEGDALRYRGPLHEQEDPTESEQFSVYADTLDLFRRGLLKTYRHLLGTPETRLGGDRDRQSWPAVPREMSPRDTRASSTGERLARMMRLDLTPEEDRETLVMSHIGQPARD